MKDIFNRLQYLNLLKRHESKKVVKDQPKITVDEGVIAAVGVATCFASPDGITWAGIPFHMNTMVPDGSILYIMNNNNSQIYQYGLNIPWDMSTATYIAKLNLDIAQAFNGASSDNRPS